MLYHCLVVSFQPQQVALQKYLIHAPLSRNSSVQFHLRQRAMIASDWKRNRKSCSVSGTGRIVQFSLSGLYTHSQKHIINEIDKEKSRLNECGPTEHYCIKIQSRITKKMLRKPRKKTTSYFMYRKECDTLHFNLSVKMPTTACVSSAIESVNEIVDSYTDWIFAIRIPPVEARAARARRLTFRTLEWLDRHPVGPPWRHVSVWGLDDGGLIRATRMSV